MKMKTGMYMTFVSFGQQIGHVDAAIRAHQIWDLGPALDLLLCAAVAYDVVNAGLGSKSMMEQKNL